MLERGPRTVPLELAVNGEPKMFDLYIDPIPDQDGCMQVAVGNLDGAAERMRSGMASERSPRLRLSDELRRRAEARASRRARASGLADPFELERLLHELEVHRVELEMQNEALRESQRELGAIRDRYFELELIPRLWAT